MRNYNDFLQLPIKKRGGDWYKVVHRRDCKNRFPRKTMEFMELHTLKELYGITYTICDSKKRVITICF